MEVSKKSGIYSHPFVFIEDHINRCIELCEFFINEKAIKLEDTLKKIILITTALHDFGKTTKFFQDYMKEIMEKGYAKPNKLSEHALLSGVYTYFVLKKFTEDELLSFFGYLSAKRHHTNPTNLRAELFLEEDDIKRLKKQAETIDEVKANKFIENLNLPSEIKEKLYYDKKNFLSSLERLRGEFQRLRLSLRKRRKELGDFFLFQYVYSLLLDADKTEAGAKPYKPRRIENLPLTSVERYKEKLKKGRPIDNLREEAFREVLRKPLDLAQRIYTLTLPTGMGKTLTGLAFALKLRDEIRRKLGYTPRIIYSLPFLSIIDQNAEVIREVFRENLKEGLIIKHHHLAEPEFGEYEFAISRLLTEGWNGEIIITTFVKLFETLISWRKNDSRRFNKLAGSIIIIDEVQALPHEYWLLIREAVEEFSEKFGTYFIFMTATQPYLVERGRELVNKEKYFSALDRIKVCVDLKEKVLSEFVNSIEFSEGKRYLFIVNTVKESRNLYKLLSEKFENVGYLSTYVTPYERLKRIKDIKEGKYPIVVSTQLVEAGVDIDFDVVYRDFAPLDSLNQSAGRCNRNMEKEKGEFRIVKLIDERGRSYASYIYDATLLSTTENFLKGKETLSEQEFISLIEEYFKVLWDKVSMAPSEKIINAVKEFKFRDEDVSISSFRLIKEDISRNDVFIELNEEAQEVWSEAKRIIKDLRSRKINLFEAKEAFERLKPRFYNYVISVRLNKNVPFKDKELGIYYVDKSSIDIYYDKTLGFKEEGEDAIFL